MGINLVKPRFFTQMTFPGLFNGRFAWVEEEGIWKFPAWMCETVSDASMGGGYYETIPCADRAAYIVTYAMWSPWAPTGDDSDMPGILNDPDNGGYWYENTERVCSEHYGQMMSWVDANPNEVKLLHVVQTDMLREFPTKPVNMRKYGVPVA